MRIFCASSRILISLVLSGDMGTSMVCKKDFAFGSSPGLNKDPFIRQEAEDAGTHKYN